MARKYNKKKFLIPLLGYVFEALDINDNKKVAIKRIEKVGEQLSREYEILFEIKNCQNIIQITVIL